MSLAAPLSRTAKATGVSTCTRIPHLRYHILRKQSTYQTSRSKKSTRTGHSPRYSSTLAADSSEAEISRDREDSNWHSLKLFGSNLQSPALHNAIDDSPNAEIAHTKSQQGSIKHIGDLVSKELNAGDADRILLTLSTTPSGLKFVQDASHEDFQRAFCAIDPALLIEPFKQLQWHSRASNHDLGILPMNNSLLSRVKDFGDKISYIVTKRLEAGHVVDLTICRHMLGCAASVGDKEFAKHVLQELMPSMRLKPDVACYNNYLQSLTWNKSLGETAKFNLRNTTWSFNERTKKGRKKREFRGHVITGSEHGKAHSIRTNALDAFQRLAAKGLKADEATFTGLMMAMAREGDLAAVDSVLKSVWHIDVTMLSTFDEEEIESPTFYEDGHHLQPSDKLLAAIVHCYSINNQTSRAWMLLDYVSRNYNLTVPKHVWMELFQWTFILCTPRSIGTEKHGLRSGQLPINEFEKLSTTLMDEPYNLEPEAVTLNYQARLWKHQGQPDKAAEALRDAIKLLLQTVDELQSVVQNVEQFFGDLEQDVPDSSFEVRQKVLKSYVEVHQQLYLLRTSMRQLLTNGRVSTAGKGDWVLWVRQQLPNLVEEFAAYSHDTLVYQVDTGEVALWMRPHSQAALWEQWSTRMQKASTLWSGIDVANMADFLSNWADLPQRLQDVDRVCSLSRCKANPKKHAPEDCPEKQLPVYVFAEADSEAIILHSRSNKLEDVLTKYEQRRDVDGPKDPAAKKISKSRAPQWTSESARGSSDTASETNDNPVSNSVIRYHDKLFHRYVGSQVKSV